MNINETKVSADRDVVPFFNGCPRCGERVVDNLRWDNDGETVTCATCGMRYNPDARWRTRSR